MEYRVATINDIDILCKLRKKQLIDEGITPSINIDSELKEFFINHINDKSLVEYLVIDNDNVIATGAVLFMEFPPSFTNKSGIKGYITNMYTDKMYRKQGIASSLLELLVKEAKYRNVEKLFLGASKLGRPVDKKFGFKETDEWLELNNI